MAAKRGGGPKLVDICTFNSSGVPQLRLAHDHCRHGRFPGPDCGQLDVPVAALLAQEHHATGRSWVDLKATMKSAGWNLIGAPAASEHSAGASISTRCAYHTGLTKNAREDFSPKASPGRVATAWVDGIIRDGILLISVYLWNTEGMTQRNIDILHAAGRAILQHGGPWTIGGDFNNTPEHLKFVMEAWLKIIGGEVCAPGNITCKSINGGRTIDFYIIDKRISHGVRGIWTQMDFPSSPHYMVVLRLEATAATPEIMKIRTPKILRTAAIDRLRQENRGGTELPTRNFRHGT